MRDLLSSCRNARITGIILFMISIFCSAWFAFFFMKAPEAATGTGVVPVPWEWPEADQMRTAFDASVFKKEQGTQTATSAGPLAKRFRLAGTFIADGANQRARLAVIDVVANGRQQLVSEGETLEETVLVKAVFRDRVVLSEGRGDEDIWLSFAGIERGTDGQAIAVAGHGADGALGRFGRRVGDKRWVLNRQAVLDYYSELLDNTERLANVFDSMKPVYDGDSIEGYVLDVRGEGEVFAAFGLAQGDIVRKVNSMPMTSRLRAEYFIREFVADRANAFVLDVERNGQAERLIYMLR